MAEILSYENPRNGKVPFKSLEDLVKGAISDGKISGNEAIQILKRFKEERELVEQNNNSCKMDLSNETAQNLYFLAQEGGFQEITTIMKERCNFLIEIEKERSLESTLSYFEIEIAEFDILKRKIDSLGLKFDIVSFFNSYRDYIKNNLNKLPFNILSKIKKYIGVQIFQISGIIDERIAKVDELIEAGRLNIKDRSYEIQNQKWIINSKLDKVFKFTNYRLLPSALLFQNYHENPNSIKNPNEGIVSPTGEKKYDIRYQIQEIDEMLSGSFTDKSNLQNDVIFDYERSYDKRLGEANGIKIIETPSILSEHDKEVEEDSEIYFMAAVASQIAIEGGPALLGSIVPVLGNAFGITAGAVAGGSIDLMDMFSDTETLLDILQGVGLVDPRYRMEKTMIDNILAGIGLLPAMTIVIKGEKLTKYVSKLSPKKLEKFQKYFQKAYHSLEEYIKSKLPEFNVFSKVVKPIIDYELKGEDLIIINFNLEGLSTSEINQKILSLIKEIKASGRDILSINFSSILKENPSFRGVLSDIISSNFPSLSIERLIPGYRVLDISFSGVKVLNDSIGKELVDLFVGELKKRLGKNLYECVSPETSRIVRSDYKHLTMSLPEHIDFIKGLFLGFLEKKDFIIDLFNSIPYDEILKLVPNKIVEDFLGKIPETLAEKYKLVEYIKGEFLKNFDFGIGNSVIPSSASSFEEKLAAFFKAESSSKKPNAFGNFEPNYFSFEKTKKYAENALNIEVDIIQKFRGQEVNISGINYRVVVSNFDGNDIINPIVLRYVRKGESIGDLELEKLVREYISHLNEGFDFISPVVDTIDIDIGKLNKSISEGKIDISHFIGNNKGTLTKDALFALSEGQKGTRAFIDIVDMGIMNLADFRSLALKVRNGILTEKELLELTKAGNSVTNLFQRLVQDLKKFGGEVSLGGDEVYIFFKDVPEHDAQFIISEKLKEYGLRGRVAFSDNISDSKEIFEGLDRKTGPIKYLEKKLENVIEKNKLKHPMFSSIATLIENGIKVSEEALGKIISNITDENILTLFEKGNVKVGDLTLSSGASNNLILEFN